MDPSTSFTPEQTGALVAVAGSVGFILKWAFSRYWKREDEDSKRQRGEIAGLHASIEALAREVRDSFAELRGLITRQDLALAEMRIELRHAIDRLSKVESRVDVIPEQIQDARHDLRNELTQLILRSTGGG